MSNRKNVTDTNKKMKIIKIIQLFSKDFNSRKSPAASLMRENSMQNA